MGFICHLGSEVLPRCSEAVGSEVRLARMSARSFSESIIEAALRTGKARLVARRDDASWCCENTGRKFCGLMLA